MARPAEGKGFSHAELGRILASVVSDDGTVDYGALRTDSAPLDAYLGRLRATSPGSAPHRFNTNDARLAYYLNAFNALVLAGVRDHCPLTSVSEPYWGDGFFWRVSYVLGEAETSLQDIESNLVPQVSRADAGVHFVLNRGASGCPPMPREAFEESTVRERIAAVTAEALRHPACTRREGDVLHVSEVFQWYKLDFLIEPLEWIRRRDATLVQGVQRIEFTPYDWSLNGRCEAN